jgi:hypothetical protein
MATKVVVNDGTLNQFLRADPTMQAALGVVATAIEETAVRTAPYGRSLSWPKFKPGEPWVRRPMRHGRYKAAFVIRKVTGGWQVWNEDPFAHLVEWGSIKNPIYAPVRTAINQLGLKLRPKAKPEPGSE